MKVRKKVTKIQPFQHNSFLSIEDLEELGKSTKGKKRGFSLSLFNLVKFFKSQKILNTFNIKPVFCVLYLTNH